MIAFSEQQLLYWLGTFLWPFFRVGAVLLAMPVLSGRAVPARARIALAFFLTWIIVPSVSVPDIPLFGLLSLQVVVHQVLIGLSIGFILQIVFAVLMFAAESIAFSMGLGFASMNDPNTGVQVPVVGQLMLMTGTLMFFAANGHLLFFELIADSFQLFPVSLEGLGRSDFWQIAQWAQRIFSTGLHIALPITGALLMVNVILAVMTRTAPQMNIFSVGFSLMILWGLIVLWVVFPTILDMFLESIDVGFMFIRQLLS